MHENLYRGRGYRWVLAAVLMAMLCGCGDDDERASPPARARASRRQRSAACVPYPPLRRPHPPPTSQARAATLEWTAPTTQTDGATLGRSRGLPHPLRQERARARSDDRDQESEHLHLRGRRPGAGHVLLRGHGVQLAQSGERAVERREESISDCRSAFIPTSGVGLKPDPPGVEDAP